jgi:hypothetical protein
MGPELPKELTFMHAQGAAGKMQERPALEAKKAHQFHYGKAASFLLIGRLGIGSLVLSSIGHRQAGAIDDFDLAGKPAALAGGIDFHALSEMAVDLQEPFIRKPLTGLTVGACSRGHLQGRTQRPPSLHFTHCLPAGRVGAKHLRKQCPEGDQGTKEPLSAASALFLWGEQRIGNHRAESRTPLRERVAFYNALAQGGAKAAWRTAEEQRGKGGEERSGIAHVYAYIDVCMKTSKILPKKLF